MKILDFLFYYTIQMITSARIINSGWRGFQIKRHILLHYAIQLYYLLLKLYLIISVLELLKKIFL